MITASAARQLRNTEDKREKDILVQLEKNIKSACKKKESHIWAGNLGAYENTICAKLRKLGYKVEIFDDRDGYGVKISW